MKHAPHTGSVPEVHGLDPLCYLQRLKLIVALQDVCSASLDVLVISRSDRAMFDSQPTLILIINSQGD